MKFYELKVKSADTTQFCKPHISSLSPWLNEGLVYGEYKQVHELPIPYEVLNKYKPEDYMKWRSGILLSKALRGVIEPLCKSTEFFPAQMYYKGKEIFDEHYATVFPAFEALNYDNSEIKWMRGTIFSIKKLALSQEKLAKIPVNEGVFHLKEHVTNIIANEAVKEAVEKTNLTGIKFIELEIGE